MAAVPVAGLISVSIVPSSDWVFIIDVVISGRASGHAVRIVLQRGAKREPK
jgi:hypothetical protein